MFGKNKNKQSLRKVQESFLPTLTKTEFFPRNKTQTKEKIGITLETHYVVASS
jgi:hypothetical protein